MYNIGQYWCIKVLYVLHVNSEHMRDHFKKSEIILLQLCTDKTNREKVVKSCKAHSLRMRKSSL